MVTTKGTPWAGLVENRAGWWIDIGVESLGDCLKEAMSQSSNTLEEMGHNGREWMKQDITCPKIAENMN